MQQWQARLKRWVESEPNRARRQKNRETIADAPRQRPPARGPRVFAGVMFPRVAVIDHRFAHGARHWPKAVTEQMNARSQSGKLISASIEGHLSKSYNLIKCFSTANGSFATNQEFRWLHRQSVDRVAPRESL